MQQGSKGMIITIQDWVFQIDFDKTASRCQKIVSDHCLCGYCRNFYSAVDGSFPQLRCFLKQFGVDVEGPEELMPFEPTMYGVTYVICGSIIQIGTNPIHQEDLQIKVLLRDELDFDTPISEECFALELTCLELPWVLEEDMDEVISPANDPDYLSRMWNKLLSNVSDNQLFS